MEEEDLEIRKNSVQETLLLPLYGRVQCNRLYPELYTDPESEKALERLNLKKMGEVDDKSMTVRFGALEACMREYDISLEIRAYLAQRPEAAVVNLGCGLDPIAKNCDNGTCRIYNLDMPDVIEVREKIFPAGEREKNIGANISDFSWFEEIDVSEGAVFIACGVFYYFHTEDVKKLFTAMNERFPGCVLVFDTAGKTALKVMLKSLVKDKAGIDNVSGYFHGGNPKKDILPWSNGFTATWKGYMKGYHNLKVKSVPGSYRFLSGFADKCMKMKIVKIEFQGVKK